MFALIAAFLSWFRSKPPPPPPPPTIFDHPWRNIQWGNKERDLDSVRTYTPHNKELKHLRVLVYGPIGAGKSSFINSVDSILQGRITVQATTDATSADSFTRDCRTYKIKKDGPDILYPFHFTDVIGFEAETNKGASVDDIRLAMMGCIKDGYKFNPLSKISENHPSYNKTPTLNDKVHVLVCVIPARTLKIQSEKTLEKMRNVRLAAQEIGIPQLAILTKIDEACDVVEADVKNTYRSRYIKEQMEILSTGLGFQLSSIFPVKNYHSEIDTDDDIDTLILSALKHMIQNGEDFVNRFTAD